MHLVKGAMEHVIGEIAHDKGSEPRPHAVPGQVDQSVLQDVNEPTDINIAKHIQCDLNTKAYSAMQ